MELGFTSNSGANLKLEFISGFAVGVLLQKSSVLRIFFFFPLADIYHFVSRLYKKKLVFPPTVCFQETRPKEM